MTETPEYPEGAGPASCRFGSGRLLPLLENFAKEIEGVRSAGDIEFIHRMRVASRRLRAALPLFETCFPKKQYRVWSTELREVTRALGEARDADVQIDFLRSYAKKLRKRGASPAGIRGPNDALLQEIGEFITRMEKKREALQEQVLLALTRLEKSGAIGEMHAAFSGRLQDTRRIRRSAFAAGIPAVAAGRIAAGLDLFLGYEPYLADPDAILEHHAMRIAAKKLRYTMEVYAPVYRLGLGKSLRRVKKIQEILGDIHDCDVWIDLLTGMIVKQRTRPRMGDEDRKNAHTLTGIRLFLHDRERRRQFLHRRVVQFFSLLQRVNAWDELRGSLVSARKRGFVLQEPGDRSELRRIVGELAAGYPENLAHSHHVTLLALSLFDQSAPLHQLGPRERDLLESAGLLHDIGWTYGQKGHSLASRDMILRDEGLPLDLTGRAIAGIAARSHRKGVLPEDDPLWSVLTDPDRRIALVISGILRASDGLDYLHSSAVTGIGVAVTPETIAIQLSGTETSSERERGAAKSDLLARALGRRVEIR